MLRGQRNRAPAMSGDKIDFKFSHFKALQVPKGWDKLFVSVISVESGKTIAKLSKSLVRNGSCQWTETVSEFVCVPPHDSSKDLEDCLFKLLVAMGSARSGILGETSINMTDYMSSSASVPVSLPLKKCSYGTILQVKIQCLTPKTKLRDVEPKEINSPVDPHLNAYYHDIDNKSDSTGSVFEGSVGASSNKELGPPSNPVEPETRETSFSSGSHPSYDSAEGSIGRENSSPRSNSSGDGQNLIGRQDSISSQKGVPHGNYPIDDPSRLNHSSFNSRILGSGIHSENNPQEFATASLRIMGSSKNLLETAEDTIEELRMEAKMWERNAQKLMLDLDILRQEFSEQSKKQANQNMELLAACTERDSLEKEVEQLKLLLEKSIIKQTAMEDSTFQDQGNPYIQKELEDEIKFQNESNANLALQLKRSQESNIELVSVLQELEDTIEKQKLEIENIVSLQSKFSDMEKSIQGTIKENRNLMLEVQRLQDSEKNLQVKVQLLEQALEDKNHEIENRGMANSQTLLNIEEEYRSKLSAKEEEIVILEANLSKSHRERDPAEMGSINGSEANLIREVEALTEKVQELERDCNELTDENLGLLLVLKETKNNSVTEMSDYLEEKMEKKALGVAENSCNISIQELKILKMELEVKVTEMGEELTDKILEIAKLEAILLRNEEELGVLKQCKSELETKVSVLQEENIQLEKNIETAVRESDITSKCLDHLQNDLMVLSSSVDFNVSANKILERKSSELESGKRELEVHLSELEQENVELSTHITRLETQLRYLTDEKESSQLELENSRYLAVSLGNEIEKLRTEVETKKADLKQKLHDIQKQLSESQDACEYLRRENSKLQANTESLTEECSSFQNSNGELRKQKLELHEHCTDLEAKLRESHNSFADCSSRVEDLEKNLSSMLEESASKERSLSLELGALLDENREYKEKLILGESLVNQMYAEKTVEVENLQKEVERLQHEVEHLKRQICAAHDERERIATDAVHEVSSLHVDKARLEYALQEVQAAVKRTENELYTLRIESDMKVQGLADELTTSKQNQEMLVADHEKLLKLLDNYKTSEDKFKTIANGLELKLTVSEYERQQLLEDTTNLKFQLQNIARLQDEVLAFKNKLQATKFEKDKVEASLKFLSGECEDLKAEKASFIEKISVLQKAVSELEDCRCSRLALEEKLLRMEGELVAKEALCAQDAELKNELNRIKRANREFQQKIQQLEEEKDECMMRYQALEEELKMMEEEKRNQKESGKIPSFSKTNSKVIPFHEDMRPSKNEITKTNQYHNNRRNSSLKNDHVQELMKDQYVTYSNRNQREGDDGYEFHGESPSVVEPMSKIQSLEKELAEAMEPKNMTKLQIKRFLSKRQNGNANTPTKATAEGEAVVSKERFERTKSSLETELKEIRERYFNMSLQYAEVEAQREELVMKLKEAKSGKRWFNRSSNP